ncbi:hypothetical protein PoMZ_06647 [Pyricularia oryzae]|uniref:Uncharacterized protein n=1 Tax=Pyricularia oryzae TaxID=318829 RepID=A0A4P7NSV0_PYROR|nr:hypothetical protein PoMZ_06647 [Pyricularia oryzae]
MGKLVQVQARERTADAREVVGRVVKDLGPDQHPSRIGPEARDGVDHRQQRQAHPRAPAGAPLQPRAAGAGAGQDLGQQRPVREGFAADHVDDGEHEAEEGEEDDEAVHERHGHGGLLAVPGLVFGLAVVVVVVAVAVVTLVVGRSILAKKPLLLVDDGAVDAVHLQDAPHHEALCHRGKVGVVVVPGRLLEHDVGPDGVVGQVEEVHPERQRAYAVRYWTMPMVECVKLDRWRVPLSAAKAAISRS